MKSLPVPVLLAMSLTLIPIAAIAEEPISALTPPTIQPVIPKTQDTMERSVDGTMYIVSYDLKQGREY